MSTKASARTTRAPVRRTQSRPPTPPKGSRPGRYGTGRRNGAERSCRGYESDEAGNQVPHESTAARRPLRLGRPPCRPLSKRDDKPTEGCVETATNPSVLVAEDDPDILLLVEVALGRAGYKIRPATDGVTALEIALRERPSLTIMDIALPGLDGLSVLDRLRADSRTATMPIMILTASVTDKQVEEGLRRGANSYVKKPFAVRDLLTAVAALIGTASQPAKP